MRKIAGFFVGSVFAAAFVVTAALASFHSAPSRDITLNQIELAATYADDLGQIGDEEIARIKALVAELRHEGPATKDDLAKLKEIKAIFSSAGVNVVRLNDAETLVSNLIGHAEGLYAHVINAHGGVWQKD